MLLVYPREAERAAVTSLFALAVELAAEDPVLLSETRALLDASVKARPGDLASATRLRAAGLCRG